MEYARVSRACTIELCIAGGIAKVIKAWIVIVHEATKKYRLQFAPAVLERQTARIENSEKKKLACETDVSMQRKRANARQRK